MKAHLKILLILLISDMICLGICACDTPPAENTAPSGTTAEESDFDIATPSYIVYCTNGNLQNHKKDRCGDPRRSFYLIILLSVCPL